MNEDQIKTLAVELGKKNADQVKDLFEAARKDDGEKAAALEARLLTELGPDSAHMKAVQEQLDQIATDLKNARGKAERQKTINEHISLACKDEAFQNIRKTKSTYTMEVPLNLQTKVAADMLNSTQVNVIPKPTWIPGVFKTPDQQPFVADLVPVIPTTSNTVYYVDRTTRNATAAAVTEGDAMTQNDMIYTQQSASIVDYGAYINISDNMLGDNDFVAAEINAELPWDVLDTLDGAIVTASLSGATAFSSTGLSYDGNVVLANEFDVLRAAINQARRGNYRPDAVLVHNDDYAMMEMNKTSDGSYMIPQYFASQGLRVSNVPIIPSNSISSGTYLVATFNKAKLAMRQNLVIEFGYNTDDFVKRMITVRAYLRAAFILSTQNSGGFISSTFAAAKAALLKP